MNLQEMTNEQLVNELYGAMSNTYVIEEIRDRLCAPKQPYQIKYKWTNNNRDIDDMKALTVWGTSPLAACQTLVDANDWRGQDMEFLVSDKDFAWCVISSNQLEL